MHPDASLLFVAIGTYRFLPVVLLPFSFWRHTLFAVFAIVELRQLVTEPPLRPCDQNGTNFVLVRARAYAVLHCERPHVEQL